MPDPLITLTTDFGEASPYVAAMKGVILAINPAARLLDLGHHVPPQDVRHASFFLVHSIPCFPPGPIHLIVVDPGVGTERALLYVEIQGHRLVVPDNGCWTALARALGAPPLVYILTEPGFWRKPVSATFHGRDVLAPVAAHLSMGAAPAALGRPAPDWVRLPDRPWRSGPEGLSGEVDFVDEFGNLITNIPGEAYLSRAAAAHVLVGGQPVPRRARTYSEAEPGALIALVSSSGRLEVAVNAGSAAERLGARVGTPVEVRGPG